MDLNNLKECGVVYDHSKRLSPHLSRWGLIIFRVHLAQVIDRPFGYDIGSGDGRKLFDI